MNRQLVSIIVPVYNVEQYIEECINSIITQTYEKLEIILVDDGSPDNSGKICDQYAEKDIRIKVIHKKNGGLSSARNAGIAVATGDLITFCDSDDVILPQTISRYIEIQQKYNCDVVSCESLLYKNGNTSIIEFYHKSNSITSFLGEDFVRGFLNYSYDCSVCNKLYKKEVIGNRRFKEGKTNEDILFQYEVLKDKSIVHVNDGLYLYRMNESGITHTFNENSLNAFYNAIYLHNKIKEDLPHLEKEALSYLIGVGYNLAVNIKVLHLVNLEPFKTAYIDVRKYICAKTSHIILSSLYPWKNKIRYIYLLLGFPFFFRIKKYI